MCSSDLLMLADSCVPVCGARLASVATSGLSTSISCAIVLPETIPVNGLDLHAGSNGQACGDKGPGNVTVNNLVGRGTSVSWESDGVALPLCHSTRDSVETEEKRSSRISGRL